MTAPVDGLDASEVDRPMTTAEKPVVSGTAAVVGEGSPSTSSTTSRDNSNKKPTPRQNKRNATDRVSRIVRAKGFCERCGIRGGVLEHAHIIPRRYSWTRTDERNGWCLCRPCHFEVDNHRTSFNALIGETIGWDLYRELEEKSRRRDKFDWAAEVERLKALKAGIS